MTIRKSRCPTEQKTIRFPVDVLEFVGTFPGKNYSEQLVNLILTYQREVPERKQELESLEKRLQERVKQLDKVDKRLREMDDILIDVLRIQPTFRKIKEEVCEILSSLP